MPRTATPKLPAIATFTLTERALCFFDRVEEALHLAIDRICGTFLLIDPKPQPDYDRPAPAQKLSYSFIPYTQELLRGVKAIRTVCELWALLKTHTSQQTESADPEKATALVQTLSTQLEKTVKTFTGTYAPSPA